MNRSLPTFHRYLRLRKRMMGLTDELHYYDLYAPLVADVQPALHAGGGASSTCSPASRRSAPTTRTVVQRAFDERWIDFYPTEGKRSGAYSNGGAYDVHPYMLLNYLGQYNDISTLAHELGHTMHSYYSNTTQPYPMANYQTFVAEVASTFNEALLIDHMLKQIKDDADAAVAARQLPREHQVDRVPADAVRRVRAADARDGGEGAADHRRRARPSSTSTSRAATTATTHGVCVVDDYVAHEWSYIPHFYRDFYVFQYATSFTAAEALSAKVLARRRGGDDALPDVPRRPADRSIRSTC